MPLPASEAIPTGVGETDPGGVPDRPGDQPLDTFMEDIEKQAIQEALAGFGVEVEESSSARDQCQQEQDQPHQKVLLFQPHILRGASANSI